MISKQLRLNLFRNFSFKGNKRNPKVSPKAEQIERISNTVDIKDNENELDGEGESNYYNYGKEERPQKVKSHANLKSKMSSDSRGSKISNRKGKIGSKKSSLPQLLNSAKRSSGYKRQYDDSGAKFDPKTGKKTIQEKNNRNLKMYNESRGSENILSNPSIEEEIYIETSQTPKVPKFSAEEEEKMLFLSNDSKNAAKAKLKSPTLPGNKKDKGRYLSMKSLEDPEFHHSSEGENQRMSKSKAISYKDPKYSGKKKSKAKRGYKIEAGDKEKQYSYPFKKPGELSQSEEVQDVQEDANSSILKKSMSMKKNSSSLNQSNKSVKSSTMKKAEKSEKLKYDLEKRKKYSQQNSKEDLISGINAQYKSNLEKSQKDSLDGSRRVGDIQSSKFGSPHKASCFQDEHYEDNKLHQDTKVRMNASLSDFVQSSKGSVKGDNLEEDSPPKELNAKDSQEVLKDPEEDKKKSSAKKRNSSYNKNKTLLEGYKREKKGGSSNKSEEMEDDENTLNNLKEEDAKIPSIVKDKYKSIEKSKEDGGQLHSSQSKDFKPVKSRDYPGDKVQDLKNKINQINKNGSDESKEEVERIRKNNSESEEGEREPKYGQIHKSEKKKPQSSQDDKSDVSEKKISKKYNLTATKDNKGGYSDSMKKKKTHKKQLSLDNMDEYDTPSKVKPSKSYNISKYSSKRSKEEKKEGSEGLAQSVKSVGKLKSYKSSEDLKSALKKKSKKSKGNKGVKGEEQTARADLNDDSKLTHESLVKLIKKSVNDSIANSSHSSEKSKGLQSEGGIPRSKGSSKKGKGKKSKRKQRRRKDGQLKSATSSKLGNYSSNSPQEGDDEKHSSEISKDQMQQNKEVEELKDIHQSLKDGDFNEGINIDEDKLKQENLNSMGSEDQEQEKELFQKERNIEQKSTSQDGDFEFEDIQKRKEIEGQSSKIENQDSSKIVVPKEYEVKEGKKDSSLIQSPIQVFEHSEAQENIEEGHVYMEANKLVQQPSENVEEQNKFCEKVPISVLPDIDDISITKRMEANMSESDSPKKLIQTNPIKEDEKEGENTELEIHSISKGKHTEEANHPLILENEQEEGKEDSKADLRDEEDNENIYERDSITKKSRNDIKDLGKHIKSRGEETPKSHKEKIKVSSPREEDQKLEKKFKTNDERNRVHPIHPLAQNEEPSSPEYKQNKPEYLKNPSKEDDVGADYYFSKDKPFDSPRERPALGISSYEPSEDSKYYKHLGSPKDSKKRETSSDEKKENLEIPLHQKILEEADGTSATPNKSFENASEEINSKKNDSEQDSYSDRKEITLEKHSRQDNEDIYDENRQKEGQELLDQYEDSHEFSRDDPEHEEDLNDQFVHPPKNTQDKEDNTEREFGDPESDCLREEKESDQQIEESQDLRDWVAKHQNEDVQIPTTNFEIDRREGQDLGKDIFRQRITEEDVKKLHEARINKSYRNSSSSHELNEEMKNEDIKSEDLNKDSPSKLQEQEEPGIFEERMNRNSQYKNLDDSSQLDIQKRNEEDDMRLRLMHGVSPQTEEQMDHPNNDIRTRDFTFKNTSKKSPSENFGREDQQNEYMASNLFLKEQKDPEEEEEEQFKSIGARMAKKDKEGDNTGKFGREGYVKEFPEKTRKGKATIESKQKMVESKTKGKKNRLKQYLSGERDDSFEHEKEGETKQSERYLHKEIDRQYKQREMDNSNKSLGQIQFEGKMSRIDGDDPDAQPEDKYRRGSLKAFSDSKGNLNGNGNHTMQDDR